jgi:hypothetical protein
VRLSKKRVQAFVYTLTTWRKRLAAKGIINPEGNPHEQFKRIHMKLQNLKKIGVWEGFVWPVS